jgi:hypothetical protein
MDRQVPPVQRAHAGRGNDTVGAGVHRAAPRAAHGWVGAKARALSWPGRRRAPASLPSWAGGVIPLQLDSWRARTSLRGQVFSLRPTNGAQTHPTPATAGKVSITVASECTHDRMTSMLGAASGDDGLRDKLQVGEGPARPSLLVPSRDGCHGLQPEPAPSPAAAATRAPSSASVLTAPPCCRASRRVAGRS